MDPTTVQPPPPPQNPRAPTDALIEADAAFDRFQKGEPSARRNMDNFKALVFKLAGRLSPAHQSLVHRRFDDILPDELLVPDHPPYADMILTALWELKAEGGSSEEDISHFIEKEYHELPWAHATILNHHLRDLCKKGKITMTHDGRYIRFSSINKPEPSPSSCSSPLLSSYSSSSTSICTSPSSSSSGYSSPNRRRKIKNIKERRVGRSSDRVRGRGRGRGRQVGQRRRVRDRFDVEERNKVEEPEQGTEDQNEVTCMEVEDDSFKDGHLPDVIAKVSEEENPTCEQKKNEQNRPQKKYNVTWIGRRAPRLKDPEIDTLNVQSDDEVTVLEVDESDAKVDEHVEQPEQKEAETDTPNVQSDNEVTVVGVDVSNAELTEHVEQLEQNKEKGATDMKLECNRQEENRQSDIVERQTLGEERIMDDENLFEEQDSVMMHSEAQVPAASVEKQHGDTSEEQIKPEENKEECVKRTEESDNQLDCLTNEHVDTKAQLTDDLHDDHDVAEPILPQEQCVEKTEESDKQLDRLTKEQAETKAPSVDLHDDDDVTEEPEPVHPQEQCVDKTEESDKQLDRLTNEQVETKAQSADLHDDDVTEEPEPVHPQEQCVEKTEESPRSCEQNQLKDVESESAEQVDHQTEVNQKEVVPAEVQQEPFVEMIEQQNQSCIQQTETSEKYSLQENNNLVRNDENLTSSSSTTEGSRRPSRQGLRSSSKIEDAAPKSKVDAPPKSKKQVDLVTPVRRTLRSHKTISEADVITEVPDHSKEEQVTYSGRTRSSKRKHEIAEAEQGSNRRKTRSTGL